jgi:hypothetical protein
VRYSRLKRNKNGKRYIVVTIAVIVVAAIIYFATAGIAGKAIGEFIASRTVADDVPANVQTPPEPQQTDTPAPSAKKVQATIKMPPITVYAVQLGAFSNSANAKQFADNIKVQGYAGYIIHDKNAYKVMASAYNAAEIADKARSNFKAKNIDSQIYSFQIKAANITVDASKDNVSLIQQCFADIEKWFETLGTWSKVLDEGALKGDDVAKAIDGDKAAIKDRYDRLHKLADSNKDNAAFVGLDQLYGIMIRQRDAISKASTNAVQLSFNIRYAYIESLDKYRQYREKG